MPLTKAKLEMWRDAIRTAVSLLNEALTIIESVLVGKTDPAGLKGDDRYRLPMSDADKDSLQTMALSKVEAAFNEIKTARGGG